MNSKKYSEAIQFAAVAHEGAYRKGTKIPYITHVVEAGLIAMALTEDEDTIVAAILHDIVEDTTYELTDIEKQFGSRVAKLVSYESEDKMKDIPAEDSWKIRKEAFLNHLSDAQLEAKIICLADKLSNIRMSVKTHAELGDDMWLVFNQKDKKMQEWYYRSIYEKLPELSDTEAYKEYVTCCDEVFGQQKTSNLPRRYYSGMGQVMYDPFVPDYARINGLVDFVSDELNGISHFFDDLRIAGNLVYPYVFLSDKVIYRTYGKLSEADLIEALEGYAKTMKKTDMYGYFMEIIKTIVQDLKINISENKENEKSESSFPEFIPTLTDAERMVELEGSEEDKKVLADIINFLSMRRVDNILLLGEYLPDRHQIMIYYNAIEREVNRIIKPNMDFYAKLSSVIAHEYFHAMHYAMAPGCILWNNSSYRGIKGYQKKEIIESLADFFSVLWCYNEAKDKKDFLFMDVARERFDSWKKYLYSAWPYSKALYLIRDSVDKRIPVDLDDEAIRNGCNALLPVFETSVHNIVKSYELLRG